MTRQSGISCCQCSDPSGCHLHPMVQQLQQQVQQLQQQLIEQNNHIQAWTSRSAHAVSGIPLMMPMSADGSGSAPSIAFPYFLPFAPTYLYDHSQPGGPHLAYPGPCPNPQPPSAYNSKPPTHPTRSNVLGGTSIQGGLHARDHAAPPSATAPSRLQHAWRLRQLKARASKHGATLQREFRPTRSLWAPSALRGAVGGHTGGGASVSTGHIRQPVAGQKQGVSGQKQGMSGQKQGTSGVALLDAVGKMGKKRLRAAGGDTATSGGGGEGVDEQEAKAGCPESIEGAEAGFEGSQKKQRTGGAATPIPVEGKPSHIAQADQNTQPVQQQQLHAHVRQQQQQACMAQAEDGIPAKTSRKVPDVTAEGEGSAAVWGNLQLHPAGIASGAAGERQVAKAKRQRVAQGDSAGAGRATRSGPLPPEAPEINASQVGTNPSGSAAGKQQHGDPKEQAAGTDAGQVDVQDIPVRTKKENKKIEGNHEVHAGEDLREGDHVEQYRLAGRKKKKQGGNAKVIEATEGGAKKHKKKKKKHQTENEDVDDAVQQVDKDQPACMQKQGKQRAPETERVGPHDTDAGGLVDAGDLAGGKEQKTKSKTDLTAVEAGDVAGQGIPQGDKADIMKKKKKKKKTQQQNKQDMAAVAAAEVGKVPPAAEPAKAAEGSQPDHEAGRRKKKKKNHQMENEQARPPAGDNQQGSGDMGQQNAHKTSIQHDALGPSSQVPPSSEERSQGAGQWRRNVQRVSPEGQQLSGSITVPPPAGGMGTAAMGAAAAPPKKRVPTGAASGVTEMEDAAGLVPWSSKKVAWSNRSRQNEQQAGKEQGGKEAVLPVSIGRLAEKAKSVDKAQVPEKDQGSSGRQQEEVKATDATTSSSSSDEPSASSSSSSEGSSEEEERADGGIVQEGSGARAAGHRAQGLTAGGADAGRVDTQSPAGLGDGLTAAAGIPAHPDTAATSPAPLNRTAWQEASEDLTEAPPSGSSEDSGSPSYGRAAVSKGAAKQKGFKEVELQGKRRTAKEVELPAKYKTIQAAELQGGWNGAVGKESAEVVAGEAQGGEQGRGKEITSEERSQTEEESEEESESEERKDEGDKSEGSKEESGESREDEHNVGQEQGQAARRRHMQGGNERTDAEAKVTASRGGATAAMADGKDAGRDSSISSSGGSANTESSSEGSDDSSNGDSIKAGDEGSRPVQGRVTEKARVGEKGSEKGKKEEKSRNKGGGKATGVKSEKEGIEKVVQLEGTTHPAGAEKARAGGSDEGRSNGRGKGRDRDSSDSSEDGTSEEAEGSDDAGDAAIAGGAASEEPAGAGELDSDLQGEVDDLGGDHDEDEDEEEDEEGDEEEETLSGSETISSSESGSKSGSDGLETDGSSSEEEEMEEEAVLEKGKKGAKPAGVGGHQEKSKGKGTELLADSAGQQYDPQDPGTLQLLLQRASQNTSSQPPTRPTADAASPLKTGAPASHPQGKSDPGSQPQANKKKPKQEPNKSDGNAAINMTVAAQREAELGPYDKPSTGGVEALLMLSAKDVRSYVRKKYIEWANHARIAKNLKPCNLARFPEELKPSWWPDRSPFNSQGIQQMDKRGCIQLYELLSKHIPAANRA